MRIPSVVTLAVALSATSLHAFVTQTAPIEGFTLSGISSTGGSGTVSGKGTFDASTGAIESITLIAGGTLESGVAGKTSASSYKIGKDSAILILSSPVASATRTGFVFNSPKGIYAGYITPIPAAKQ